MMKQVLLLCLIFGGLACSPKMNDESQNTEELYEASQDSSSNAAEITGNGAPQAAPPDFDRDRGSEVLEGLFQKFNEKDYFALKDYFTPDVDQFITLKNIRAEEVTKTSQIFFKNKNKIAYKADFSRMESKTTDAYHIVTVPLEMSWTENDAIEFNQKGTYLGRHVEVILELLIDEDYKIASYIEKEVIIPKYKLAFDLPAESVLDDQEEVFLKGGTVVQDNFYRRFGPATPVSLIQVLYQGKAYWIPESEAQMGRGTVETLERVE